MNQPSRKMPSYSDPPMTVLGWMAVGVLVVAFIYLLSRFPWCIAITAGLAISGWIDTRKRTRKLATRIQEREGESICGFARSFNTRVVDTWVIRAVFEALQAETEVDGKCVPIRADDSLTDDLLIDEDDLDLCVVEVVAQRCGRGLDCFDENPMIGKVKTAGDLVMFFNLQPVESKAPGV